MEADPDQARAILGAGARERPTSASIQYSIARLQAREGRRDAALNAPRKALELVSAEQREELRADMRAHDALASLRDQL